MCSWHMMVCRSTVQRRLTNGPGPPPGPEARGRHPLSRRPRRPRWQQPVLALGNFDGLHRGHIKIIERVRRVATERGATAVVMTFDPHPPRVVRPDKAPPLLMTKAQRLEATRPRGHRGRRRRPLHAASCRSGIPRRSCARCSSTGCTSPKCGSAPTSCSATTAPATSRCCAALGARYGFRAEKIDPVRYKDFVVSSTRIRRLISEGRVDEAGGAARPSVRHRRHGRGRRPARPHRSGFRRRTWRPRTS